MNLCYLASLWHYFGFEWEESKDSHKEVIYMIINRIINN